MSGALSQNNMPPTLNPQISKDLAAYEMAMEMYQQERKEIQKLAAALSHMKNPMLGVQEVMGDVMNLSGEKISSLSALDNVDTDLRNELQTGQNNFNSLGHSEGPNRTSQQNAYAKKFMDQIDDLEKFIKWQQSLGSKSVIGKGTLANLQSAISQIKSAFTFNGKSFWGDPKLMADNILSWVANGDSGKYSPELKAVTDGMETINQSTSALSTTTNTQLQFTTQQFKQFMGIDESSIQSYLKLNLALIQNEKSN